MLPCIWRLLAVAMTLQVQQALSFCILAYVLLMPRKILESFGSCFATVTIVLASCMVPGSIVIASQVCQLADVVHRAWCTKGDAASVIIAQVLLILLPHMPFLMCIAWVAFLREAAAALLRLQG